MKKYNIDFTDETLDREARPCRDVWIAAVVQAFEDAVLDPDTIKDVRNRRDAKLWRREALDWWFNPKYTIDRDITFSLANWDETAWRKRLMRSLMHKMPDHISDGPQTPEDAAEMWDSIFNRLDEEPTDEDRDAMREDDG
jgi:hypothetical protein